MEKNSKPLDLPDYIPGLGAVMDKFDAFIFDIWGVLHDGVEPYAGVIPCLQELKRLGKPVVLLSNTPLLAARVQVNKLDGMGLLPDLFTKIVTSGDSGRAYCEQNFLGKNILRLWYGEHESCLNGMDYYDVTDPHAADVLFAGLVPHHSTEDQYDEIFKIALERKLPMVCANPDRHVNFGEELFIVTGIFAERYQAMGGQVTWFGKPYPSVYERALKVLNGIDKKRILAVGDSLHTDVTGAVNMGIPVAWNLPGIHWEEIRAHGPLDTPNPLKLAAAMRAHVSPDYLLMGLKI